MSPLKQSNNIAARMGRWSASHWKTATFGWLAFVIASFAVGIAVPDADDRAEGRRRRRGRQGQQDRRRGVRPRRERSGRARDRPVEDEDRRRSRVPRDDRRRRSRALSGFEKVDKLHSPLAAGNEGQISPDRHSVLITFSPRGTYDEAALYIDTIVAATAGGPEGPPGLLRRRGRRLDREGARQGDQRRASRRSG